MIFRSVLVIAIIFGAAIAAIAWLTRGESGTISSPAAAPSAPPGDTQRLVVAREREPEGPLVPPPTEDPGEVLDHYVAPVEVELMPLAFEPPPMVAARATATLAARIKSRCGRLEVQYAPAPVSRAELAGRAALVVDLEASEGRVRLVRSTVQLPGKTRPALVACAQWALRGAVLPAPGAEPGEQHQAYLLIGTPASP